jgi:hypothetical protein
MDSDRCKVLLSLHWSGEQAYIYTSTTWLLLALNGSVVGWGTMLQTGRSRVRVPMWWIFSSFQPHYGPGVDSATNRNEYQESSGGGKVRPVRKADNLTAICELIV